MEWEIENQKRDLAYYAAKLRKSEKSLEPSSLVFTGSGDSLGCAFFGQALSEGKSIAAEPFELTLYPEMFEEKTLVMISVSGRTKANIRLAKFARKFARNRIAITANPNSPLAKLCDRTITLEYEKLGILTAGTVSFTSCLLALSSLLGKLPPTLELNKQNKRARRWSKTATRLRKNTIFVGSGLSRGLAAYGAFKMHEVLGYKADHEFPGQLGHSRLFSLRRRLDSIVCIGSDKQTVDLYRKLSKAGFSALSIRSKTRNRLVASLEIVFHLQYLVLEEARGSQLTECAFLAEKKLLEMSNNLIY
jgi:fructoselysine-6-P-deglycase FrlB-like protein